MNKISALDALDQETVAALLEVSPRQVTNYINTKGLPSRVQGRTRTFLWSEVREWDYSYRLSRDKYAGTPGSPSPQASVGTSAGVAEDPKSSEARRASYMADLKLIELKERQGQLVHIAEVARILQAVAKALQVEILGWPTRIIGTILGIRDRNELYRLLTAESEQLCTRLSQLQIDAPAPEEAPEDNEEATEDELAEDAAED